MAKNKKPTEKTETQPASKVDELKSIVKDAKVALTTYYKENKLKRDEDYTDDAKHGTKIGKLQKTIEKAESKLAEALEEDAPKGKEKKTKKESSSAGRETKYDYPADCVTAEDKKKFRIQARKAAEGGDKPKKEKAPKGKSAKADEAKVEAGPKGKKKKSKVTVEEKATVTKGKKKKAKKSNDD
jgi:hypothetical protein